MVDTLKLKIALTKKEENGFWGLWDYPINLHMKISTAQSGFKQVVMLLVKEGLLSLKKVFTDGTKIKSVAGRYTFVWENQ